MRRDIYCIAWDKTELLKRRGLGESYVVENIVMKIIWDNKKLQNVPAATNFEDGSFSNPGVL